MKRTLFFLAGMTLAIAVSPGAGHSQSAAATIVRLDSRFDKLVPRDAKVERVADGFKWVEGPVWQKREGFLLFSDIPNNAIFKWREGEGTTLFMKPSGYTGSRPFPGREAGSNGLAFDREGRLTLAEHGDRRIARLEADGSKTTLAAYYHDKRLNSPNDLVYKSGGDLYFTDPPYGLPKTFDDPGKELDFQGVYRLAKGGELTLLTRELRAPNGLAFSPDEKTLYVSNADAREPRWWAFEVGADGALGKGRVFFDATPLKKFGAGAPDGIKVDRAGNIFTAGPGGIHVFAPDGTHLGSIVLGIATGNCAFGDDGATLYITASNAVYRLRLKAAGF